MTTARFATVARTWGKTTLINNAEDFNSMQFKTIFSQENLSKLKRDADKNIRLLQKSGRC